MPIKFKTISICEDKTIKFCSFSKKGVCRNFTKFRQKWSIFKRRVRGTGPCRSGRSVADSLFRPHPEQSARASREPKHIDRGETEPTCLYMRKNAGRAWQFTSQRYSSKTSTTRKFPFQTFSRNIRKKITRFHI